MSEQTSPFPTLGRYELVHLLGQGGMGEVYLAKLSGAAGFEKPCIVKTILPSLLSDPQFLDRFAHEAKVLVHLQHSNIAQVHDMGQANGTYFMALEYVAGVDLSVLLEAARLQRISVPLPIALYVAQKVAEGLGYAHRKTASDGSPLGIVHRDVSPQNVMVSYEGEVKVIDFGLAKSSARSKHTLPSTVMGKLGYMSPEQVRGDALDHRTDLYALGVVLWELLAGRALVPHGTMGEMMAAMMNPKIPSLSQLRPEISAPLEAIVLKALAVAPGERYARAEELARALNEQLVRSGASVGAEELGAFVKQLCPEAFAAQRQLISKLSMLRKRDPQLQTGPKPLALVTELETGTEGTFVRSPVPASPAAPAPTTPPRKSVLPIAFGAIALAGLGVGGYLAFGQRVAPAPAKAIAEAPRPAPAPVAAPAPVVVAEPPSPAPAPAPVEADPGRAAPGSRLLVKKAAELFSNRSGTFARAGSADLLEVGMTVEVVAPKERKHGDERKVLGTATIVEVWPKLARVELDPDAAKAKGGRFAALPLAPRPRPVVVARPASSVTPVAASSPPPVAAVAAQPEPAAPAPAPQVEPAKAAAPARLQGRASVSGSTLTLYNTDEFLWTDCQLAIPGRRSAPFNGLGQGGKRDFALGSFKIDARAREMPKNQIEVKCKQGSADFAARF